MQQRGCSNKRRFVIQVSIHCCQEHLHYIEFQLQSINPSFHSFHFIGSTMSHTDPYRNQQQQQQHQQGDQPLPRTSERTAPSQPANVYPFGAAPGAFAHHHQHPYAAAPPHMLYHPTAAASIATAGYPQHPLLAPTTAATATVSEKYRYIYLV